MRASYIDDENVTSQAVIQKLGDVNKNGRTYDFDTVQEALRNSNIEKLQLSSMYGMFGECGTFDKSKEIKVTRIEDLDDHNGFKPGYLYCFQRQLKGSLCEKCESKEQCIRDKENEVDRIKNIVSHTVNSFDIPIDVITSMRRKEDGD